MIKITKDALLPAIQFAASATKRGGTMPILSNLLIRVVDGTLSATGTNLESEITARTPCDEAVDTEFTVPAKKFVDVVKAMQAGADIKLDFDGQNLVIKSGRSKFKLSTLPAVDFPDTRAINVSSKVEIDQQVFKQLIGSVSYAMAKQDVRYYLNGMLIDMDGGKFTVVATDGHRLALRETVIESQEKKSIIVPADTINEMAKILKSGPIVLEMSDNSIRVDNDHFKFVSKLIDGKFPDYRRVIPTGGNCKIVVSRDGLLHTLSQVAILSNEKFRGIRLTADGDSITIAANNPDNETAESVIDVQYNGDPIEIGFNVQYLMDAVNSISAQDVEIVLRDANCSAIVRELGDESSVNVVMPMRL
jgi:DNA polymerase-3 subunit beta